eukprot:6214743-Pleurochrysis_carterae.AAC.1
MNTTHPLRGCLQSLGSCKRCAHMARAGPLRFFSFALLAVRHTNGWVVLQRVQLHALARFGPRVPLDDPLLIDPR